MSCSNPWYKQKIDSRGKKIPSFYDTIPCGTCACCRRDARNTWEDRINYEIKGKSSAFVTFTYDDEHIFTDKKYRVDNNGLPSLCKNEAKDFLDNLKHKVKAKLPSPLCIPNFHYFLVGEYGDTFGRPHYHALFLGLDFFDCRKIFHETWKNGIIDSLPILEGGIRYVLKYTDKQQKGAKANEMYDMQGIERPFMLASKGLGANLFFEQAEMIKETGNYKNLAGKERPCPQYYKNLIGGESKGSIEKKINEYKRANPMLKDSIGQMESWLAETMYARERYMQDLELQSGHAILRTQKADTRGTVKNLMYSEMAKTFERKAERFNEEVMKLIYERFTA